MNNRLKVTPSLLVLFMEEHIVVKLGLRLELGQLYIFPIIQTCIYFVHALVFMLGLLKVDC